MLGGNDGDGDTAAVQEPPAGAASEQSLEQRPIVATDNDHDCVRSLVGEDLGRFSFRADDVAAKIG